MILGELRSRISLADRRNIIFDALIALRKRSGLTQEELATRLNLQGWDIDRLGLSKIERATRGVSEAELYLLAKALGAPMEKFFPDDATMKTWMAEQSLRWKKK